MTSTPAPNERAVTVRPCVGPERIVWVGAPSMGEYREFLDHNELGLAFEALRDAAKLVPSRGGVWKDLIRTAEFMELHAELPELRARFEATAARQSTRL